jgi:UDP-glucose 4-epimerase
VVDNLVTGSLENLRPILDEIEFMEADLRDPAVCARSVKDIEIVFHQAALGSVPRSIQNPLATHEANATATLHLLRASREAGVKRLVCASSSSIYGANPVLPKSEDLRPMPISPYAVSKLAQEQYCLAFHQVYGLETVALRYFNVYGPRQDPGSAYAAVVPLFIAAGLANTSPTIHGDGEQTRDFTYVDDVVAANLAAAEAPAVAGQVINIAAGRRASVNEIWNIIKRITGAKAEPIHAPPRPGDVRHSFADTSQARTLLNWRPQTGLEEGLAAAAAWIKTRKEVT